MTDAPARDALEQSLARLTDRTLSRFERYAHAILLFFAGGMAFLSGGLLFMEPNLPKRAEAALAVMLLIALAWVVFAIRVLLVRMPVLANREVIAARMALGFSTLFTVGMVLFSWSVGGRTVTTGTMLGATMACVAIVLLVRARRRVAELRALRAQLERELAAQA